eukprot:SAG31_NODE_15487_length_749_cov_1.848392_2_plen_110_part_01
MCGKFIHFGAPAAFDSTTAQEVDASAKISVFDGAGRAVWHGGLGSVTAKTKMPEPAEAFAVWAVADRPRFAVPRDGAIPGTARSFDLQNQAADVYFFVPDGATDEIGLAY